MLLTRDRQGPVRLLETIPPETPSQRPSSSASVSASSDNRRVEVFRLTQWRSAPLLNRPVAFVAKKRSSISSASRLHRGRADDRLGHAFVTVVEARIAGAIERDADAVQPPNEDAQRRHARYRTHRAYMNKTLCFHRNDEQIYWFTRWISSSGT
jgi:hypothetical protein